MLKIIASFVLPFCIILISGCSTASSSISSKLAANTFRDKNPEKAAKIEDIIQRHLGQLKKTASYQKPVLLKDYGVPIRNPFSKLPTSAKQKMMSAGIDIEGMSRYQARYINGSLTGTRGLTIINTDPTTILVVGSGTTTHNGIYSRGPIVATGDALFMDEVYSKDLLWYGDESGAGNPNIGLPVVRNKGNKEDVTFGVSPYTAKEEIDANIRLGAEKIGATWLKDKQRNIDNPLKKITAAQRSMLQKQGVNVDRLAKLKAVVFTGDSYGGILNDDPQTLLVVNKDFGSVGVMSLGPVISYTERVSDIQLSASLLWFASPTATKYGVMSDDIRGMPVVMGAE